MTFLTLLTSFLFLFFNFSDFSNYGRSFLRKTVSKIVIMNFTILSSPLLWRGRSGKSLTVIIGNFGKLFFFFCDKKPKSLIAPFDKGLNGDVRL